MSSVRDSSSDSDEGLDRSFSQALRNSMILHDMVHKDVELPLLCKKIINTPQFDRLRHLKQLGLCYHVYPSASHNRFEHCIGTSHLAGVYGRTLLKNQPELEIDEKDILCLYVAGLCHDLGHGPFSHTWEKFMRHYEPGYSHEEMSLRMLDYMIEDNDLGKYFTESGLDEKDLTFIKECIVGRPLNKGKDFEGRGWNKHFLYQIVNNEETKIDVDKFDYLLRDGKQLHLRTTFDYERVLENSRVHQFPAEKGMSPCMKIVYRKKISSSLEDLFHGRFRMHQKAYQHRATKIIETMVLDGLHAAEPHLKIRGKDGTQFRLSTAHEDITAFSKLTDSIAEWIVNWTDDCGEAAEIFNAIMRRQLYKNFGFVSEPPQEKAMEDLHKISKYIKVIPTKIDYGKGEFNPLNDVYFYEKSEPDKVFMSKFPASTVERKCFIVHAKVEPEKDSTSLTSCLKMEELKRGLQRWSSDYGIGIQME